MKEQDGQFYQLARELVSPVVVPKTRKKGWWYLVVPKISKSF